MNMHAPLLLRRAAGSLLPLVTGLLALACGESGGDTTVPLDPPTGNHVNELALALDYGEDEIPCGESPSAKLYLVSDLTFQDRLATGWIALSGMDPPRSGPPVSMAGSESLVGQVAAGVVTFDPLRFSTGSAAWQFKDFTLRFYEDGKVDGTAKGTYQNQGGDVVCPVNFTGTLTGGPDVTPPSAAFKVPDPGLHLPFDPIAVTVDEPVHASAITAKVAAGGMPLPTQVFPQADKYPGLARALSLAPVKADWPAGVPLSVSLESLTDAAGHVRDVDLGTFEIAPALDAGNNLGFENGLSRWIADPPQLAEVRSSLQVSNENGQPIDVNPTEGASFAVVTVSCRLAAHLVPPAGKKSLHLQAAMANLDPSDKSTLIQSLSIKLFAQGALFASIDGTDLSGPDAPKTASTWTGWHELIVDLPAEAASGFWIQVQVKEPAPFGFAPFALLDGLAFE
jgi:hypothetical protein